MKFSIAIPAYKSNYLAACIDSILAQTYTNFELIIVNDASPDDIDSIVNSYNDSRIRYYVNEKNFGAEHVVDNWNKCLSYARGEYFVLMGDDDLLEHNYLEEFQKLIAKYPKCNVYHCRSTIINEFSEPIKLTDPRPEFENVYDSILQRIQGKRVFFISDYVYKTDTLKENGGFYKLPLAWASDDISSYIATRENGIAHTNKLLFKYRKNSQTISLTGNVKLKMKAAKLECDWIASFLKNDPFDYRDKIVFNSIKNELPKYLQKRIITLVSQNISQKGFLTFLRWLFFKRSDYNLKISEIVFALVLSIKDKKNKNIR